MENLVGCASQIRDYEQQRQQHDKAASEQALPRRQMVMLACKQGEATW